jgi:Tubulin like
MASELDFRPTLIVGAGGTGCEIAERVYRRLLRARKGEENRVRIVGIDTDANDMSQRRGIELRNRIQTSTTDTLYHILSSNPEVEQSFCLTREELPENLLNMRLVDGAAQIRMFSHLALFLSCKTGALQNRLGDIIAELRRHDGRADTLVPVNVLIVGSIAGATGSGSFIQLAALIRRIAREREVSATVRAVLLLPDVFVYGARLPAQQIANVLANGYASIKELAGVIARAERQPSALEFNYQFAPGLTITDGEIPFEHVTFIDFENNAGGNLGASIEAYKEMASRAVFQQLFTPIGQRIASVTVNNALSKLAAASVNTSNMYSGIGIAGVVYPADDVARYLGLRFAQEMLAGDWLRLDRLYVDRIRRFEEQRAKGNTAAHVEDRGQAYLEDLDQLALRDRITFFVEQRRALRPLIKTDDKEEIEAPLATTYLDAVVGHIIESFWAPERMNEVSTRPPIGDSIFANRDRVQDVTRRLEISIDDDLRVVEQQLFRRPEELLLNTLVTENDLEIGELRDYHLRNWIEKSGPHPVLVRAFLFAARRQAAERRAAIDVDGLRNALMSIGGRFSETESDIERARGQRSNPAILDRARRFQRPGLFDRLSGKAKAFYESYAVYYNDSNASLRRYANAVVEAKVLDLVIEELDAASDAYTALFAEIGKIQEGLRDATRIEEERHSSGTGALGGNVFIDASPEAKRALWTELSEAVAGMRLADGSNREVNAELVRLYRQNRRSRRPIDFSELRRLFEKTVIEKFAMGSVQQQHRGLWDVSVIAAVRREAARAQQARAQEGGEPREQEDWRSRLKRAVDVAAQQAEPFLALDAPERGERIIFWAINPEVQREYADDQDFNTIFTLKQGEQPLIMDEFNKNELLCVNNRVNLEVANLAKFASGVANRTHSAQVRPGRYFSAYDARISRLIEEELAMRRIGSQQRYASTITPHIHKSWHLGEGPPEIQIDERVSREQESARAFIIGYGLGLIQQETDYGRPVTMFSTVGRGGGGGVRDKLVDSHSTWAAYQIFKRRADLVRATTNVWATERAAIMHGLVFGDLSAALAVGGTTATQRIIELAAPRDGDKEKREAAARTLFAARYELLLDVASQALPNLDRVGRGDVVEQFHKQSIETTFAAFENQPGVRPETVKELRMIETVGTGDARASAEL